MPVHTRWLGAGDDASGHRPAKRAAQRIHFSREAFDGLAFQALSDRPLIRDRLLQRVDEQRVTAGGSVEDDLVLWLQEKLHEVHPAGRNLLGPSRESRALLPRGSLAFESRNS